MKKWLIAVVAVLGLCVLLPILSISIQNFYTAGYNGDESSLMTKLADYGYTAFANGSSDWIVPGNAEIDGTATISSATITTLSATVANLTTINAPTGRTASYVPGANVYCMGDSLTFSENYGKTLNYLLGSTWNVIDKGISGNTTTQMLARFTTDIHSDASYVIIWGGINDIGGGASVATIESNLQSMYTLAHNSGYKVVAVNISPSGTGGTSADKLAVNAWIASTATNVDYRIDVYSVLNNPGNNGALLATYNSGDNTHLSSAGYIVVANTIYSGVTWTTSSSPSFLTNGIVQVGDIYSPNKLSLNPINQIVGTGVLEHNTTGYFNLGVGANALNSNTTGSQNSAFGQYSLFYNTTGGNNSTFGQHSLTSNTTGSQNSAFGQASLYGNTTGVNNSAFGQASLTSNTTGSQNSAFGQASLYGNTTGSYNSVFGLESLNHNTTGSANSAFGTDSLFYNTTGSANLGLGYYAGLYNTTVSNQLFINALDQGSYANDVSKSLIYGVFNSVPSSQVLAINAGKVKLSYLPSYVNNAAALLGGLVAGDLYRLSGGSAVDPEPIFIVH